MLHLERKKGEVVNCYCDCGAEMSIHIKSIGEINVKMGFDADEEINIYRSEIDIERGARQKAQTSRDYGRR